MELNCISIWTVKQWADENRKGIKNYEHGYACTHMILYPEKKVLLSKRWAEGHHSALGPKRYLSAWPLAGRPNLRKDFPGRYRKKL
jgi:hypothetical protein